MSSNLFSTISENEFSGCTPLVPRLSTLQMISSNEPLNQKLRALLTEPVPEAAKQSLKGKKVAIVSADGVEEIEITTPLKFFRDRGAQIDVVSPKYAPLPHHLGVQFPDVRKTHIMLIRFMENAGWLKIDKFVSEVSANDYDAVIVPGGCWNPDMLRGDPDVMKFIKAMYEAGKPTCAICHGPLVLVSAGLLKGKKATSYWSCQVDLTNAGATVTDVPLVVDKNLITSRFPTDLPEFLGAIASALTSAKH